MFIMSEQQITPPKQLPKVCVIGGRGSVSGAGVTQLINGLKDNNKFSDEYTPSTMFDNEVIEINDPASGGKVKLIVSDTSSSTQYETAINSQLYTADVMMVAVDLTDPDAESHAIEQLQRIKKFAQPGVSIILVGTKSDAET